nr:inositol monophosphatase family protein [Limibaculum sp. NKW23]
MPEPAAPHLDADALEQLLALAHRLADAGGAAALPHFRTAALTADNKHSTGFDPVTAADRGSEAAIRALLDETRPLDGVFGEEEAPKPSRSGLTWVIDPIDGTRAFISGLPTWGVLIALDDGASGRIGVVYQPFTGERFTGVNAAGGGRAEFRRGAERRPMRVRACPGLAEATLFTTAPEVFSPEEAAGFARVSRAARLTRYGIDCYAYALLALGQVDLVIEAGLAAYDIAAPAALIRAAGGIVTDWDGGDPRWGGRVIAAGDPRVHRAALELLAG